MNLKELENLTKCSLCKKIYEIPIILPCSERICHKDLNWLLDHKSNRFECFFCDEEHCLPEKGFRVDQKLNELINMKLYKLDLSKLEKNRLARLSCEKLHSDIVELKRLSEQPSLYLNEYFAQLRNEIDLKREQFKQRIEVIYKQMLDEVKEFEEECLSRMSGLECGSQEKVHEFEEMEDKVKKWNEILDVFEFDEKNWDAIRTQAEVMSKDLEKKANNLKENILLSKLYKVKSSKIDSLDMLFSGELIHNKKVFY
jgi:hypothetical protein